MQAPATISATVSVGKTAAESARDREGLRLWKTCATHWMDAGIPIRTIQHWLGHKELETTQRYLGVGNIEELRGKIDAAFGD